MKMRFMLNGVEYGSSMLWDAVQEARRENQVVKAYLEMYRSMCDDMKRCSMREILEGSIHEQLQAEASRSPGLLGPGAVERHGTDAEENLGDPKEAHRAGGSR